MSRTHKGARRRAKQQMLTFKQGRRSLKAALRMSRFITVPGVPEEQTVGAWARHLQRCDENHHAWVQLQATLRYQEQPEAIGAPDVGPEQGCYEYHPDAEFPEEYYPHHDFDQSSTCNRCSYSPDWCVFGEWGEHPDVIGPEWFECTEEVAWRAIRACAFPMPMCDSHKRAHEQNPDTLADPGDRFLRFEPYNQHTDNSNYFDSYFNHGYRDDGTWTWDSECHCDTPREHEAQADPGDDGFWTPSPTTTST